MRYSNKFAALGLAGLLSAPPAEAQKQAHPYNDTEFLKLYDDVRRFEDANNYAIPDDEPPIITLGRPNERTAGNAFYERAVKLAESYSLQVGKYLDIYTCGKYVGGIFYNSVTRDESRFEFGEFFAVTHTGDTAEKIRAVPGGVVVDDVVHTSFWGNWGFNMQPAKETPFWDLRDSISLYNVQIRKMENGRFLYEKSRCIEKQLQVISKELSTLSGVDPDYLKLEVRAPGGSNRIVVEGFRSEKDDRWIETVFVLSITPDGTTDVWMKDPAGNEKKKTVKIEFPKK